jgi:hypothetical protein
MHNKTFSTKDEKGLPGHNPSQDRLTLLLGGKGAGDFKLKLMLVMVFMKRR